MPVHANKPIKGDLQDAAFVQARLLDQFIALTTEVADGETGFARDSLADLLDTLRDQRRHVGTALRPRVISCG